MYLIEIFLILLFFAGIDFVSKVSLDYIDGEINKEFSINKIES